MLKNPLCVLKNLGHPQKAHNVALDVSCATCHLTLPELRKFLENFIPLLNFVMK